MLRSRFGRHLRSKKLVYRVGETIRIESHGGAMAYQLDGEAPAAASGDDQPATTPMMITVEQGVVPVMVPQKLVMPAPSGPVHAKAPSAALA
jgi:hypothetical protein